MNKILTLILIVVTALVLMSCAAGRYPYPKSQLGVETLRSQIDRDPGKWAMKAGRWFMGGGDSRAKIANTQASYGQTRSNTIIRVSNFHSIKATGDFQIQITGDRDQDKVLIEGPNDAVRSIIVRVNRNVLCLEQEKNAPKEVNQVIIHISMKELQSLVHNGLGSVEGVQLDSDVLHVEAAGCGNIFLAGHLNVNRIVARGPGSVNIFTVRSHGTQIETYNAGSVNFAARREVSLRSIRHKGSGNVNVIGARSDGLVVDAEGKGKIGIYGVVSIREIRASGKTCVFIDTSSSSAPCIYVYDDARVGVAGRASTLNAYATSKARFLAHDLVVRNSYVQASGESHMNVTASNKIFATAYGYASIYFYGDPNILTAFKNQDGVIVNMDTPSSPDEVIVRRHKAVRTYKVSRPRAQTAIKMGQNTKTSPPKFVWRQGHLMAVSDHEMYV